MRAHFINEVNQFTRGLDPKSAMGIGRIGELERKYSVDLSVCTPNQIIILGVKEGAADMIQYALDLGANQLWYKLSKLHYHGPVIPTPDFSSAFVVITKVKERMDASKLLYRNTIETIIYKDITKQLLNNYSGKPILKSSTCFAYKYTPVDSEFMELVIETIKNGTILKRFFENNFKQ